MRRILVAVMVLIGALGAVALTADSAPGASAPSSPLAVKATPGNASAVVSWTRPLHNGGAAINAYKVATYLMESPQPVNIFHSTKTSQTILSLENGKSYTFRVAAHNAYGWSRLSAESSPVVVGTPSQPTNVVAVAGNTQALVSWTAPATNSGSAINGYRVTAHTGTTTLAARTFTSTATSHAITGLTNGKSYTFQVAAHNARGWGVGSPPTAAVIVGSPVAPTHVSGVPGSSRATVSWTAPTTNNGAAVDAYRVSAYLGSTLKSAQTFNSTATQQVITGLTSGKGYRFRVEAHNSRGWSVRSAPSAIVTPT